MRSYEYLKVPQSEKRRTDILRLGNIRLFEDGLLLNHSNPQCECADNVSITFEFQKKDERNDTVTQKDTDHAFMSPVKIWYAIVKKLEVTQAPTTTPRSQSSGETRESST